MRMLDRCNENHCTRLTTSHKHITSKDVIVPSNTPPPMSFKECFIAHGEIDPNDDVSNAGIKFSTFSTENPHNPPLLSQNYVSSVSSGVGVQEKVTLNPANSSLLTVLYWNGGGCMLSRLCLNPELKLLLSTKPDIFVYAETLLFSKPGLALTRSLQEYDCYHVTAVKNSCRRGISVFYLKKHRFILSKDLVSKKHDIVWVKLENKDQKMVFCFFYAAGENKSASERIRFYDELREGYKNYSNKLDIFLLGDSNA